ncbi:MAG: hypothetical protein KAT71_07315 [Gammaproteobacteria bacterium]|nr:hypothetical protein [Gammaproteobacteria bacterium]
MADIKELGKFDLSGAGHNCALHSLAHLAPSAQLFPLVKSYYGLSEEFFAEDLERDLGQLSAGDREKVLGQPLRAQLVTLIQTDFEVKAKVLADFKTVFALYLAKPEASETIMQENNVLAANKEFVLSLGRQYAGTSEDDARGFVEAKSQMILERLNAAGYVNYARHINTPFIPLAPDDVYPLYNSLGFNLHVEQGGENKEFNVPGTGLEAPTIDLAHFGVGHFNLQVDAEKAAELEQRYADKPDKLISIDPATLKQEISHKVFGQSVVAQASAPQQLTDYAAIINKLVTGDAKHSLLQQCDTTEYKSKGSGDDQQTFSQHNYVAALLGNLPKEEDLSSKVGDEKLAWEKQLEELDGFKPKI